jgi:tetratricopeptide (TPR) repeat protein
MPSRRSLAELTLDWCAGDVFGPGATWRPKKAVAWEAERDALGKASRDASRAAGVALLQAAAAELDAEDIAALGKIAGVIEDENAAASLEGRLGGEKHGAGSPRERRQFVGQKFKEWLEEQLGAGLPSKVQAWLARGWPDPRTRGGIMTFYQAFCGALQRAVRQDQSTWDDRMKNTGLDAATWRQWLIREADPGSQALRRSTAKKAAKVFAIIFIFAVIAGGAAWYWWSEISARLQALDQLPGVNTSALRPSPHQSEITTPVPASTPAPKKTQTIMPKATAPNLRDAPEELPRVSVRPAPQAERPDPLAEAARHMDEAERTLGSANPEAGDVSARSALDILSAHTPPNGAPLAEGFTRVAQYWERRDDWAEAARIHQRAVKAYEKTPAENADPQLQEVNRWAAALRHTGRNTEAEKLYRMLLQAYEGLGSELRPEMASVAHNLGNLLSATDRLRDAREYYVQALTLLADRQSNPRVEPLLSGFKDSYQHCLRKLGVSEAQIDAGLREILDAKNPPKPPPHR